MAEPLSQTGFQGFSLEIAEMLARIKFQGFFVLFRNTSTGFDVDGFTHTVQLVIPTILVQDIAHQTL
jgi:hypothetical protein